jgi:hypothetical protein
VNLGEVISKGLSSGGWSHSDQADLTGFVNCSISGIRFLMPLAHATAGGAGDQPPAKHLFNISVTSGRKGLRHVCDHALVEEAFSGRPPTTSTRLHCHASVNLTVGMKWKDGRYFRDAEDDESNAADSAAHSATSSAADRRRVSCAVAGMNQ